MIVHRSVPPGREYGASCSQRFPQPQATDPWAGPVFRNDPSAAPEASGPWPLWRLISSFARRFDCWLLVVVSTRLHGERPHGEQPAMATQRPLASGYTLRSRLAGRTRVPALGEYHDRRWSGPHARPANPTEDQLDCVDAALSRDHALPLAAGGVREDAEDVIGGPRSLRLNMLGDTRRARAPHSHDGLECSFM